MRVPRRVVRAPGLEPRRSRWAILRLVVSLLAALFLSGATVYDPARSPDRPGSAQKG